ncbi:MAG: hypothetical protein R2991_09905 [Thermoanaerobaculia bacterium]
MAALKAGVVELDAGRPEEALGLLRTAAVLGPDSPRAAMMMELARRAVAMDRAMDSEVGALDDLETAEQALRRGRFGEARTALASARDAAPDHPRLGDLEARLRAAEAARARAEAPEPEPVPEPVPMKLATAEAPPVLPLETPPVSHVAQLIVDFQSERSKGALTIYSDERQIFREGFHFTEKTRFLLNRGTEGSFSRTLEHPDGPVNLRIYLSLPGVPTQVVRLQGALRGGASKVLRVRVDAEGGFTARLQ